jgi:hypothetical protein
LDPSQADATQLRVCSAFYDQGPISRVVIADEYFVAREAATIRNVSDGGGAT